MEQNTCKLITYICLRAGIEPTGDISELIEGLKKEGVITDGEAAAFLPFLYKNKKQNTVS